MGRHRCYQCDAAWEAPHRVPGRTEPCAGCGADLTCCRNCRFYAPGAPNDCREPNAERVGDKTKANFCDYFEFAEREASGAPSTTDDTRQHFDDLFKS